MTNSEIYGATYYSTIALILAILAVAGLGLMLQVDRYLGRWVSCLAVPAMGLGTALSSAFSGRDLKYAFYNIEGISFGGGGGNTILRIITAIIVGLCVATVVAKFFVRRIDVSQFVSGQWLVGTFYGFYFCNAVFNAAFGTIPSFTHNVLYLPLIFSAVYLWRAEPLEDFVNLAKWMLLAFTLGSLLLALLKPSLAVEPNYKGWIPGLTFRLWGLSSHANSLGPLALLFILLEWMCPSGRWWSRFLNISIGLAVVVLAQSKTAWAAGLSIIPILAWYKVGRAPAGGMRIEFAISLIAGLLVLILGLAFLDIDKIWHRIATTRVGMDVATLSGRAQIWAAAVTIWENSLVFGYGPTAWGPEHRAALGMPFAFSAHNQFLQSMSTAGTLGLLSLLVYLAALGVRCLANADATCGASVALFIILLLRCITETPLSPGAIFNGDMIAHLVIFRIALGQFGVRDSKAASQPLGSMVLAK